MFFFHKISFLVVRRQMMTYGYITDCGISFLLLLLIIVLLIIGKCPHIYSRTNYITDDISKGKNNKFEIKKI